MHLIVVGCLVALALLCNATFAIGQEQAFTISSTGERPATQVLPDPIIRGVKTKSEEVKDYFETEYYARSLPIGLLDVTVRKRDDMSKAASYPCTAWLIDKDRVITAWHCMPGVSLELRQAGEWDATRATVTFLYDNAGAGRTIYPVLNVVESNQALDYAILQLDARGAFDGKGLRYPGELYGVIRVAASFHEHEREPIYLFHHPYGYFKMVLKDPTCRIVAPERAMDPLLYHQCDTRGGSSGAPILTNRKVDAVQNARPALVAIGLHTAGLEKGLVANDFNFATRLSAIVAASPYLQSIACESDATGFNCPDLPAFSFPRQIYFPYDQAVLTPEAQAELLEVAKDIKSKPPARVQVTGHTDADGFQSYKLKLSERMARAVADALVTAGVSADLLTIDWKGSAEPQVVTPQGAREPLNRRVSVQALY